jgi:hypothetical protein
MKNGRNTAGQFSTGNTGRPKGSRNKATLAIESLLQGQAEALTQTAVTKALVNFVAVPGHWGTLPLSMKGALNGTTSKNIYRRV